MVVARSLALFALAAVGEIGGALNGQKTTDRAGEGCGKLTGIRHS